MGRRGSVVSGECGSHEGMEGISGRVVFVGTRFSYCKGRNLLYYKVQSAGEGDKKLNWNSWK